MEARKDIQKGTGETHSLLGREEKRDRVMIFCWDGANNVGYIFSANNRAVLDSG